MSSEMYKDKLATLEVKDSVFWGFCRKVNTVEDAKAMQNELKEQYPDAQHYATAWSVNGEDGYDEDNEPEMKAGPPILEAIQGKSLAIVIVRWFGKEFLGVRSGRLEQCYERIAEVTVWKFEHESERFVFEYDEEKLYGLGAGDTEVIRNMFSEDMKTFEDECVFDDFKGSKGESLPRLQNLQGDRKDGVIPIYRYPGNYDGTEWDTFDWTPSVKIVKEKMEKIVGQKLNHCVTNFYRKGSDKIGHHTDKALDIAEGSKIVVASFGAERIMELKRIKKPRDVMRFPLASGSLTVLGPKTNQHFTHSILKSDDPNSKRISLTIRDVATFKNESSGLIFGQGARHQTLEEAKKEDRIEKLKLSLFLVPTELAIYHHCDGKMEKKFWYLSGAACALFLSVSHFGLKWYNAKKERRRVRDIFTKMSVTGTKY